MGDLIQIRDYQKKRPAGVPLPEGHLLIVAAALTMAEHGTGIDGLAWPGMDIQAPYVAPEKDPA